MIVENKASFVKLIDSFKISTPYVVIKPNWVSNKVGEFTEPEILDWLLSAFPNQRKIVLESYTPWRADHKADLKTDLISGKIDWDEYRRMDEEFLTSTGIKDILKSNRATYLNITNEYWAGRCADTQEVKSAVGGSLAWPEFCGFVPRKLFEIRDQATLISLAKIKLETGIPQIMASLSIKNLFGLIPQPSRREPYHGKNHQNVVSAVADIFQVYSSLFSESLWINEGIISYVKNYCEPTQEIIRNKQLVFAGQDAVEVDAKTCLEFGLNPLTVPYLNQLS